MVPPARLVLAMLAGVFLLVAEALTAGAQVPKAKDKNVIAPGCMMVCPRGKWLDVDTCSCIDREVPCGLVCPHGTRQTRSCSCEPDLIREKLKQR